MLFKEYILNIENNNTMLYKSILGDTINKLPFYKCSSKVLSYMLKYDLNTIYKMDIFNKTYLEYFKYILNNSQDKLIDCGR